MPTVVSQLYWRLCHPRRSSSSTVAVVAPVPKLLFDSPPSSLACGNMSRLASVHVRVAVRLYVIGFWDAANAVVFRTGYRLHVALTAVLPLPNASHATPRR